MTTSCCGDCRYFVPPLPIYEPNSMGECQIMDAWLDKFPGRRPPVHKYDANYRALGNQVFMPLIARQCKKFIKV